MIDQATNFEGPAVWDDQKYHTYFRLSSCPVLVVIRLELKIDPKIVHHRVHQKRVQKPARTTRSEGGFYGFFSKKPVQN